MDRFWQPEQRLVYGYLYVEEPDETRVPRWTEEIAAFCTTVGYQLGSIFIDHDLAVGSFARAGFIELLATLRRPESYAVVVPSLAHFSMDTSNQHVMVQMIRLTDSQLLVSASLNDTRTTAPSAGVGTVS